MRVLFVSATYLPTVNGVTYHLSDTKRELEKLGHRILILAPRFSGYSDTDPGVVRYPSLPNPVVPTYPIGLPLPPKKIINSFQPQIIHTHHPFAAGVMAKNISRQLSAPLFFTAHTQYHAYLDHYLPLVKTIGSELVTRNLLSLSRSCTKIICPSVQAANRLNILGIQNTLVIPNGINTRIFYPPRTIPSVTRLKLIYVGRIDREKNPELLIDISSELNRLGVNFQLQIIGSGNHLSSLGRRITDKKLDQQVILPGVVDRHRLPGLYQSANIFITPSVTEVMPISILEALACGLPVIALNSSGLGSLVAHQTNGLLLPPSPEIIAAAIRELRSQPKQIYRLSKNAVLTARKFSLQNSVKLLEKTYLSSLT